MSTPRAIARLRRAEEPEDSDWQQTRVSPQEDLNWTWWDCNTEKVMEWDTRSVTSTNAWSGWNWNFWKETSDNYWNETQAMLIEDYEEAPPLLPEPVLAWFLCKRVDWRPEKERNMIPAAKEDKYELDLVEPAMKIQFPLEEIRNHDDRTGKYNNNILGSAVNEEEDRLTGDLEVLESSGDDLDVLATAQEEEVEALTSLATNISTLRHATRSNTRYGWHGVSFLNNSQIATATTGDWNGSVSFVEDHIGPHNVQRSKEGQPKRREMRKHMWHTVKPLCPFTSKRACSHKKR